MYRLAHHRTMSVGGSRVADTAAIISGNRTRLTNSSRSTLLTYIRRAFVIVWLCLMLCGCAAGPNPNPVPAPHNTAGTVQHQECGPTESPPSAVAKQPNYRQIVIAAQVPNNQPMPKLPVADLTLYQGTKQIPIAFFQQQPATVGILVDTSGSMEEKLAICRSAIRSFVNDLDSRDDIFLFAFSERAYLLVPPATDQATLLSNLSRLHAFGRTAIYDSINEGLSMLSKSCYPTKTLFLITDGMDTSSSNHLETIVARASKANVPIYSIGIGKS
jgi:Ca-activated chloride channel family protein